MPFWCEVALRQSLTAPELWALFASRWQRLSSHFVFRRSGVVVLFLRVMQLLALPTLQAARESASFKRNRRCSGGWGKKSSPWVLSFLYTWVQHVLHPSFGFIVPRWSSANVRWFVLQMCGSSVTLVVLYRIVSLVKYSRCQLQRQALSVL